MAQSNSPKLDVGGHVAVKERDYETVMINCEFTDKFTGLCKSYYQVTSKTHSLSCVEVR